jgi:hypothetical protein
MSRHIPLFKEFLNSLEHKPRRMDSASLMLSQYLTDSITFAGGSDRPTGFTPMTRFPMERKQREMCEAFVEWFLDTHQHLRPALADAPPVGAAMAEPPPMAVPDARRDEKELLKQALQAEKDEAEIAEMQARLAEAKRATAAAKAAKIAAEAAAAAAEAAAAAAEVKRKEEAAAAAAAEAKRKEEAQAAEAKRKQEEAAAAAAAEAKRKEEAQAAEAKRKQEEAQAAEAKRKQEAARAAAEASLKQQAEEKKRKEEEEAAETARLTKARASATGAETSPADLAKKELEEFRRQAQTSGGGRPQKRERDDHSGATQPAKKQKDTFFSTLVGAIPVIISAVYDAINDPDGASVEADTSPK